uniref:Roadblock/LAMTOR2 domain-containing protein n=1 Tax=Physcomitrium patens TaxID=3218 RepID=A0A7I4ADZ5_PHYPA|nr:dynein light chain roadblock-type 2-like [Physcomitrium patens]|eukprot:XP_024391350.1 dynein light chain roadblock-type 2-like [Physcomitrella patens]
MGDVEKALRRILNQKDIIGLLLIDQDGNILRNTIPVEHAEKYTTEIPALIIMVRSAVREIECKEDLTMMRIRSRKHEMMIVVDEKFTLMVLQEYPGFWIEPPPLPPTPQRDSDDDYDNDDE